MQMNEETVRDGHRPRRVRQLQTPDGGAARSAEGEGVEDQTSQAKTADAKSGVSRPIFRPSRRAIEYDFDEFLERINRENPRVHRKVQRFRP